MKRWIAAFALTILTAGSLSARGFPLRSYRELVDDADLVVIVRSRGTRRATKKDVVVSIHDESGWGVASNPPHEPVQSDVPSTGSNVPEMSSDAGGMDMNDHEPASASDSGLEAVITKFDVLATLKGDVDTTEIEISHYRFRKNARRPGNPCRLVDFRESKVKSFGNGQTDDGPTGFRFGGQTHYMLILSTTPTGAWTFITGQCDPELSVRRLSACDDDQQ